MTCELARLMAEPASAAKGSVDDKTTRVVVISLHEVELKLTLTAKFLSRPFRDAAVVPFLKAYSKKVEAEQGVAIDEVSAVLIDGLPADMSAPCAELLPIADKTPVELRLSRDAEPEWHGVKTALAAAAAATGEVSSSTGDASQNWREAAAALFALSDGDSEAFLGQPSAKIEESITERAIGDGRAAALAAQVTEASFMVNTANGASSRAVVYLPRPGTGSRAHPGNGLPLVLLAPMCVVDDARLCPPALDPAPHAYSVHCGLADRV